MEPSGKAIARFPAVALLSLAVSQDGGGVSVAAVASLFATARVPKVQ